MLVLLGAYDPAPALSARLLPGADGAGRRSASCSPRRTSRWSSAGSRRARRSRPGRTPCCCATRRRTSCVVWSPVVLLVVAFGLWPGWLLDATDPVVRRLLGRLVMPTSAQYVDYLAIARAAARRRARRSLLLVLDAFLPAGPPRRSPAGWRRSAWSARLALLVPLVGERRATFCVPGRRPGAAAPAPTSSTTSRWCSRRWCWPAPWSWCCCSLDTVRARRHPAGGVLLPAARLGVRRARRWPPAATCSPWWSRSRWCRCRPSRWSRCAATTAGPARRRSSCSSSRWSPPR